VGGAEDRGGGKASLQKRPGCGGGDVKKKGGIEIVEKVCGMRKKKKKNKGGREGVISFYNAARKHNGRGRGLEKKRLVRTRVREEGRGAAQLLYELPAKKPWTTRETEVGVEKKVRELFRREDSGCGRGGGELRERRRKNL